MRASKQDEAALEGRGRRASTGFTTQKNSPYSSNGQAPGRRGICYIAPDVAIPFPSGASVHVIELASNLSRLGHEVHVVARRVRKDEKPMEEIGGFTVHRVYRSIVKPQKKAPARWGEEATRSPVQRLYHLYLRTIFAIYVSWVASRVIRQHRLEVILERETAFGAGGLASVMTSRPLLLEIIGPRYSELSAKRSSRILYYTDSMLRDWVDRRKCKAVPAGVNTGLFHPDDRVRSRVRHSLGFRDDDIVVGYVGSFQSWHGIDILLDAVSRLKSLHPNLKMVLVGPSYESFQSRAQSLGLGVVCSFVGPVAYELTPSYINACDIAVAPYNPASDELRRRYGIGWPLKVLEYMACGKPVVSTRVPPVDRVISDGDTGLMVGPGDPEELASAISHLASDRAFADSISSRGKILVDSTYSWSSVAHLFSTIVGEV